MLKRTFSHLGIFFLTALSLLPLPVLYGLARFAYFLLYRVFKYRRPVVRQNLKNSFPEKSAIELQHIEKEFYNYLADLVVEVIKMRTISERELRKRFVFKNKDLMEVYFSQGQSVLVCASHHCNWEWASVAIGLNFSATNHAIYKPLSNPIFDNWFRNMRGRFGTKMVAMRQTLRAVAGSNGEPSIFCFGSDQAPSKDESNYWTTFLNQQSSIQLGIEKIAKKTNQPIFYLKISRLKRGYYQMDCVPLVLEPKLTADFEITELHTQFLEQMIKEQPAYWLWSHKRWKHQPKFETKLKEVDVSDINRPMCTSA
jgi:KDO2-lipid IV(A) lauroyltransferase